MKKSTLPLLLLIAIPAVSWAGASASAFKKGNRTQGENYWNANSAIDNKLETAWMVPGESANLGEWIMLDAPKGTLDGIRIVPGYAASEDTFADYARVKKMRIDILCCADSDKVSTTGTATVDVADEMTFQTIDIDDLTIGNELFGGKVKLSVVEIYEGRDFPSLAVSEIRLQLKEFENPSGYMINAVSGESDEHISMDMMDEDTKTFWSTASEGASFTLEPQGVGPSSLRWMHAKDKTWDRAKKVKITANQQSVITEIPNKDGQHVVDIPAPFGFNGSAYGEVTVEILEVHPGTSNAGQLAVGDVLLYGSTLESF